MSKTLQGRQNTCAMRELSQRVILSDFIKGTLYAPSVGKAVHRALENRNCFRVRIGYCLKSAFGYFWQGQKYLCEANTTERLLKA